MDDPRFSKLFTDPKFRNVPKKERKVKIDDRFKSMFKDKRFVSKVGVDKRGRPGNFTTRENFEKFYDLQESDSEEDSSDEEQNEDAKKSKNKTGSKPAQKKKEGSESKEKIRDMTVDYARGEAYLSDSSSGEDSSDDDSESDDAKSEDKGKKEDGVFDKWGELDHDAETTSEATKRLAVCNMDWDRVGADDLFLVLNSFCPTGGRVLSVTIFPSDFGKQRLAEEEIQGPAELRSKIKDDSGTSSDESDSDDNDGNGEVSSKDMERVRKYQVNRLKYFYAVAEFNSLGAANKVYEQCDGAEYELSGTQFDLRFIPDDMEFADDEPRDKCDKAPEVDKYKPKSFSTTALSLGKVDLTWDETDPERTKAMQRAFETDDLEDSSLRHLIALSDDEDCVSQSKKNQSKGDSDDGEEEEDEEAVIAKYRALLAGSNENDNSKDNESEEEQGGMEVTFVPKDAMAKQEEDRLVAKMAPWEQYLHKKKEKRNQKREKLKQAKNQDGSDSEEASENNSEQDEEDDEVPSDVDLNDPFFQRDDDEHEAKTTKTKAKTKSKSGDKKKGKKQPVAEDGDLALLMMDSDDDKAHFDYKEIVKQDSKSKKAKKKALKRKATDAPGTEDNFQVDLKDNRFSAIFDNSEFHVDPSHPNFKKTKSMQKIIEEKQNRILKNDGMGSKKSEKCASASGSNSKKAKIETTKKAETSSLSDLANAVKTKSDRMQKKKHKKMK